MPLKWTWFASFKKFLALFPEGLPPPYHYCSTLPVSVRSWYSSKLTDDHVLVCKGSMHSQGQNNHDYDPLCDHSINQNGRQKSKIKKIF
eukprot:jgi/Botrbrau1/23556/Bobra.0141s0027.1